MNRSQNLNIKVSLRGQHRPALQHSDDGGEDEEKKKEGKSSSCDTKDSGLPDTGVQTRITTTCAVVIRDNVVVVVVVAVVAVVVVSLLDVYVDDSVRDCEDEMEERFLCQAVRLH